IGTRLRDGIERQALAAGLTVFQTGPVQMQNLRFADDRRLAKAGAFCGAVVEHGVIVHPRHNWFVSAAHTDQDVERALEATGGGSQARPRRFARGGPAPAPPARPARAASACVHCCPSSMPRRARTGTTRRCASALAAVVVRRLRKCRTRSLLACRGGLFMTSGPKPTY